MTEVKAVKEGQLDSYDPNEEYATSGIFTQIFDNPPARLLDQATIVGNMEQTITMLVESTNLSYKTVKKHVGRLMNLGLMRQARKIGNASTYTFRVENHLSSLIECGQQMQIDRLKKEIGVE